MQVYKTKTKELAGTSYSEIKRKALRLYFEIKRKSKRKPYIRSVYFKKDKVFLDLFWAHLFEKHFSNQKKRLKLFPCAIELVQKTQFQPISKVNPNKSYEVLHRFTGITATSTIFFVCIKEDKRAGRKFLISIFPQEKN